MTVGGLIPKRKLEDGSSDVAELLSESTVEDGGGGGVYVTDVIICNKIRIKKVARIPCGTDAYE